MFRFSNVAWITLGLVLWASPGMAQAPYYAGKTITIVAGTKAGDVYDTYARLFAQHMPKYIPGNPNIIVQNMPGAGSMIAANHLYNGRGTRRLDHRRDFSRALFRPNRRAKRSPISIGPSLSGSAAR